LVEIVEPRRQMRSLVANVGSVQDNAQRQFPLNAQLPVMSSARLATVRTHVISCATDVDRWNQIILGGRHRGEAVVQGGESRVDAVVGGSNRTTGSGKSSLPSISKLEAAQSRAVGLRKKKAITSTNDGLTVP